MVDRQDLRDKAKGVGSAVAGTFSKGAQAAKSAGKNVAKNTKKGAKRAKKNITGEQDVEVYYNQEAEKYLLYVDGEPVDQFDSEMQAKAAAREIQRGDSDSVESTDESTGRFQQFATSFAEGVNETVANAAEGQSDGEEGPGLLFMDSPTDDDQEPNLAFLAGDTDGDGQPELAFLGNTDNPNYTGPELESEEEETNQPFLPGFGGPTAGENQPMLPGFGGGGGDMNQPQLPGFGMGGDDGNQPYIPGFGGQNTDGESDGEPTYPWMF